MIQTKRLMKNLKLLTICLIVNSCAGMSKPPKIDIGAILTKENVIKMNHIENYNEKTCKLETKLKEFVPLILEDGSLNPKTNGMIVVPYSDFVEFQNWAITECKNFNENKGK